MARARVSTLTVFGVLAASALSPLARPTTLSAETAPVNPSEIRIGILTDLTGKGAHYGQQTRMGTVLLEKEMAGQPVRFIFGDHGLDTVRAVSEAQKMIEADKVDAVLSNFSGTSRAAAPIVKKSGKVFVYAAAAVEPLKGSELAFKSYLDYVDGCRNIASLWKAQGLKKIALLKAEAEFGELCEQGAKDVIPGLTVTSYKVGEDVSSQVLKLKSQGADGILDVGYEGDIRNLVKATKQLGYTVRVGGNEDMFTEAVVGEYPQQLAGAVTFGMPRPTPEFAEKLKAIDPVHATGMLDQAGMAYLHLKQMVAALRACPKDDSPCVAKHLSASPASPEFGFERWRPDHQAQYAWGMSEFQGGKFVRALPQ